MQTAREQIERDGPVSFADELDILHGPRRDIARFFLAAESFLDDVGVTLSRVDPKEMVALNRRETGSWWRQVAVLDAEDYPPVGDELVCFIGRDRSGEPVTAKSMRLLDLGDQSVKAAMESLRLFYGPAAASMRQSVDFRIDAPTAVAMTGRVAYLGGFWVHPRMRGSGLSFVVPRVSHYAALGIWPSAPQISIVQDKFARPDVAAMYDLEAIEPSFAFERDGKTVWKGCFVWSSPQHLEQRLRRDTQHLLVALSVRDRSRQNHLPAADLGRERQAGILVGAGAQRAV